MAPSLLEAVQTTFSREFRKNKTVARICRKVRKGGGTYADALEFADATGKILAQAYAENLSSDVLPDGKMYYNIAARVVQPMLEQNFALASKVAGMVQENLNQEAGLGIKAVLPELEQDRIDGFLNRLSSEEKFDGVKWILGAPVEAFTEHVVDQTVRHNAEMHYKAGLRPKIVRTMVGNCCDWCKEVAGTYYYPDVPKDVYRRHDNCNCIVEYFPGDGKVQNVHSKRWYDVETQERVERIERAEKQDRESISAQDRLGAFTKEQENLLTKYGSVSEMMLFASGEELKRWNDLTTLTGLSEADIRHRLLENVEKWEGVLNAQTNELRNKIGRETLRGLSEDEKGVLGFWTTPSYGNINRYERFGSEIDPISKQNAIALESILQKTIISEELVARRNLDNISTLTRILSDVAGVEDWENDLSLLEGKAFIDKGFVGTTIDNKRGGFSGKLEMLIHVPAGTHGAYIEGVSHAPLEKELLLQNGLKYRIIKAEYIFDNPYFKDEAKLRLWIEVLN